jgi:Domain of unknown function (DUF6457)
MSTLDDWLAEATSALNLPVDTLDPELRTALLDATRDVAHHVTRIAGPLTTYLLGVAVGRGAEADAVVAELRSLADKHAIVEPDE